MTRDDNLGPPIKPTDRAAWQQNRDRSHHDRAHNLERLLEAIKELIEPRVTTTAIPGWTASRNRTFKPHKVVHDPLLSELAQAVYPGGTAVDDGGARGHPGSRSPARDAAIDRLIAIRVGVLEWTARLRLTARLTEAENLAQLRGHANSLSDDMIGWLGRDVARWATWARVVTGWQTPPFRPHVPCPACERVGGLMIRGDTNGQPADACCVTCGQDWRVSDGSIWILADLIRLTPEGESA